MNPADITELIRTSMPLCETLGFTGVECSSDRVVLEVASDPGRCTSGGIMHGGTLMALADSAGALCAFMNLPADAAGTSTIESKTNMLGAVSSGTARATSTPLHIGSTTIVIETSIHNGDRLVAKTTQTQVVKRARSSS